MKTSRFNVNKWSSSDILLVKREGKEFFAMPVDIMLIEVFEAKEAIFALKIGAVDGLPIPSHIVENNEVAMIRLQGNEWFDSEGESVGVVKVENTEEDAVDCHFVSVWEDNDEVMTKAVFYPKTGLVEANAVEVDDDLGFLRRQYIILSPDGTEREVCPSCNNYILKDVVFPDATGNGMSSVLSCSDPECESHV